MDLLDHMDIHRNLLDLSATTQCTTLLYFQYKNMSFFCSLCSLSKKNHVFLNFVKTYVFMYIHSTFWNSFLDRLNQSLYLACKRFRRLRKTQILDASTSHDHLYCPLSAILTTLQYDLQHYFRR